MKKVFLIGDSIRYGAPPNSPGYGVCVKQKLEGIAEVYAPDDNCRFAQYTLRHVHEWASQLEKDKIDVVHWNNGLWDVVRMFWDDPLTPIDVYVLMLERTYKRLKMLFPNARIIFATSTSVIEEWGYEDFMRYNSEIEQYNAAAVAKMEELGVEVNDLYAITKDMGPEYRSDWVHYNQAGSEKLADAVVEKICNAWK